MMRCQIATIKYHALFLLLIIGGWSRGQTPSPSIVFEERVHDFGTIAEEKGKVSHTFVFRNNGSTPVTIHDIYSGCGCVGKIVSKAPVKPGEKGKVTITFNPDYKSGFFSKEVTVLSDNGANYNRIWVQGFVKPCEHPIENDYPYDFGAGLHMRSKVMAFGYLGPGSSKQMELHYANDTSREMTLTFRVEGNHPGLRFTNPGKIGPRQRGVVNFLYTLPPTSPGDVVFTVYPYVNGKKLKEGLTIKVLNEKKL